MQEFDRRTSAVRPPTTVGGDGRHRLRREGGDRGLRVRRRDHARAVGFPPAYPIWSQKKGYVLIELSNVRETPQQVAEILRRYARDKFYTPR
jgi:hypothetical protein